MKFRQLNSGALFIPIGFVSNFTTTGYGIVMNSEYLEDTDFTDSTDDLSNIVDNTFEGDGNNYFERQAIRIGGATGSNYVVLSVSGTSGTDTITLDRTIEETAGANVFISQYKSLIDRRDGKKPQGLYLDYFIFLVGTPNTTTGQLHVIFGDGTEIVDFETPSVDDLSLFPIRKIVRDDNNVVTDIYFCKAVEINRIKY